MICLFLGCQHFIPADFSLGEKLPCIGLLLIGNPGSHRACRNKHCRQVTETQGPHQKAGDNLIANPQHEHAVKHIVGEPNSGRHGNHIPAHEAQLHAGPALGGTIAHGRHPTSELGHAPCPGYLFLDDFRNPIVGLMGRDHIIVCGNDADIRFVKPCQCLLVCMITCRDSMGNVGAIECSTLGSLLPRLLNPVKICLAKRLAALSDTFGNFFNNAVHAFPPILLPSIHQPAPGPGRARPGPASFQLNHLPVPSHTPRVFPCRIGGNKSGGNEAGRAG